MLVPIISAVLRARDPGKRPTHFVSLCNRAAMISLLAFCGHEARNKLSGPAGYLFSKTSVAYPLTNTDSLRHSRVYGAPLLFRPTRKRPRQATPPSRHREQQQGEEDEGDDDRGWEKKKSAPSAGPERRRREPESHEGNDGSCRGRECLPDSSEHALDCTTTVFDPHVYFI